MLICWSLENKRTRDIIIDDAQAEGFCRDDEKDIAHFVNTCMDNVWMSPTFFQHIEDPTEYPNSVSDQYLQTLEKYISNKVGFFSNA